MGTIFGLGKGCAMGYDSGMKWRVRATVAALGLFLVFTVGAAGQVNGVPASVTSMGFGGHFTPGVPASVTSLGPRGFGGRTSFFTQPQCCVSPLFPNNPNGRNFHHRHNQAFFPGTPVYSLPYTPVVIVPGDDESADQAQAEEDDDRGGPTIFDRRGSGQYERFSDHRAETQNAATPSEPEPVPAATIAEQTPTVLVYKDGHSVEVLNYAILGNLVYDLTPGHPRKIPLGDLDLDATAKQNDDRGVDFRLPAGQAN